MFKWSSLSRSLIIYFFGLLHVLVSLGFFDDIFIPYNYLQENSDFNSEEQIWVWLYDENEMFMDIDEDIRFRVEAEQFFDTSPSVRPKKEGVDTPDLSGNSAKQAPYSLTVRIWHFFFFFGLRCWEYRRQGG